ncbi:hypothetical protein OC25_17960 [Pedobacter kyungheensis]|uniref:Uncharacterized protein n=1 Tax=Pedobacter kyungheensis TaxID=1069985 RepID=A0A0C1FGS1_9SPHI|nr:hypothetical protein OC25_17960 [Pedobacter kyungheensis]
MLQIVKTLKSFRFVRTRINAKNAKKIIANTINPIYSVYVYESVNLDDGDSAIAESPFLFSVILSVVEGSLFSSLT